MAGDAIAGYMALGYVNRTILKSPRWRVRRLLPTRRTMSPQIMQQFSLIQLVLASCFVLVWAFIFWLECSRRPDADRDEHEAASRAAY